MTQNRWSRIKEVLGTALELRPEARADYVADACGTDVELRAEVEALLASSDEADDFIEKPALALSDGPAEEPDSDYLLNTRLGNYRIVQLIGEGGMGVVYRAIRDQGDFPLQVAVKVVKRGMDSKAILRRFREERRILARFDHPNIAKLLDGGITPDGRPYFVMEFLEGTPIHVYCQKHQLSVRARLHLFLAACDAVEYSHRNLVVHRDLKATNILVSANGVPKLLDFGIAKLMDRDSTTAEDTTMHADRLLTPDYASPEQIRGEAMTTSTDVYSLGVLLFELLTGRRPFQLVGLPHHEMARIIATTDPSKPSSVVSKIQGKEIRGDLDRIVLKATHRDAKQRYASAQQLGEDLRRHLNGQPVTAQPDRITYRVGKFLLRHRAGVSAAATITAVVFASALAVAWQTGVAASKDREARKRFTDLRELATSFLGELDGELEKLPGSTPAREMLANKVLRYLDMLARDDIRDRSLQRELASAYERLGDVQGGPKGSNLGNSAAAMESYGKSLAILDKLSAADPNHLQLSRDLAAGYSKMSDLLSVTGDHRAALDYELRALEARERWFLGRPDEPQAKRALAASLQEVSSDLERLGEYGRALEHRKRALQFLGELHAGGHTDANLRLALALAHKRLGRNLVKSKDYKQAIPFFDRAMALEAAEVAGNAANRNARINLAFTYDDKGWALVGSGDYPAALLNLEEAHRMRLALAAADPKDVRAASLLAATKLHLGIAKVKRGQHSEGIADLRASLARRQELAAIDPKNAGAQAEVAEALASLGDAHLVAGSSSDARESYRQAHELYIQLQDRGSLAAEFAGEPGRLGAALARLTRQAKL